MTEFPNEADKKKTFVKFSAPKDKFLQFSRDMKEALALLENAQTLEWEDINMFNSSSL